MGSRRPTRYVLVPGPVIIPGFRPSTRPTRSEGVSVLGKSGSIQLMPSLALLPALAVGSCHAEIAPLHRLVALEARGRALVDDLPLVHDVHAVGDPERQVIVLLDQQDRQALGL